MPLLRLIIDLADSISGRAAAERIELAGADAVQAITLFEIPGSAAWRIDAYFEFAPDMKAIEAALAPDIVPLSLTLEPVPDENWVAISQAALPPVEAGRFVIHGSHDRQRVGRRITAIEIDAGEAFGTAHHATTQGCLLAIDRLARLCRPRKVLDLGCGSGVLAIAAARALPAAAVIASDIDPAATAVAQANATGNRMASRVKIVTARGLDSPMLLRARPYDLVLANILAGPLIALAPQLARAILPGGIAVLSGILADQSRQVEAAYRSAGFILAEKRIIAGWATLTLTRRLPG
jgi:ribosomal protein L11 methyltransferase